MSLIDFRADLHCHSTFSDGTLNPKEIVDLAVSLGLSGLAITDHDSAEAYPAVLEYADQKKLKMITGVEFSAMHQKKSVHILAYSFFPNHPAIQSLAKQHKYRRQERNLLILKNLEKLGLTITEEELHFNLSDTRSIGRPHIAWAMVKKGYVATVQDAFKRYLGDNKPAFAGGNSITVEETLAAIHEANGLAVIAHPHLLKDNFLLQQLLTMPFDGIECYYSKFLKKDHKRWLDIADKKKMLITGGSDFHGLTKPTTPLGCSWIDYSHFLHLYNHFKNNRPLA